mmetsp:Transcript_38142/g.89437  ORF Transcript_38142/g.89437 Transcript_38142/m.89437 type:complete len:231 (+) Transcript_38142:1763-2455(+)
MESAREADAALLEISGLPVLADGEVDPAGALAEPAGFQAGLPGLFGVRMDSLEGRPVPAPVVTAAAEVPEGQVFSCKLPPAVGGGLLASGLGDPAKAPELARPDLPADGFRPGSCFKGLAGAGADAEDGAELPCGSPKRDRIRSRIRPASADSGMFGPSGASGGTLCTAVAVRVFVAECRDRCDGTAVDPELPPADFGLGISLNLVGGGTPLLPSAAVPFGDSIPAGGAV